MYKNQDLHTFILHVPKKQCFSNQLVQIFKWAYSFRFLLVAAAYLLRGWFYVKVLELHQKRKPKILWIIAIVDYETPILGVDQTGIP